MRADSGQRQELLMVTVDDYNYEQGLGAAATTAPIFQQHAAGQDNVIPSDKTTLCCLVDRLLNILEKLSKIYSETRAYGIVRSHYNHFFGSLNYWFEGFEMQTSL